MAQPRGPSTLRIAISIAFVLLVWGLYAARLMWGIGPMRDDQGQQAPVLHYLGGAIAVTLMTILWVFGRAWWERRNP